MSCDAEARSGVTAGLATLMATAAGFAVANVYYGQSILGAIGADLGVPTGSLGLVTAMTQTGYLVGLILLVPLGDLLNRRGLIVSMLSIAAAGLTVAAVAPHRAIFFGAVVLVGAVSVVVQVIVAYAASLSDPGRRGAVVGAVTSGVVIGILLARSVSGTIAAVGSWRSVYGVAALAMVTLAVVLAIRLPRDTCRSASTGGYRHAIGAVVRLTRADTVFRRRSLLGLLMFAAFGAVWGSVALPLAAAPWQLSTGQIGAFGLAAAVGALAASQAGRMADRGVSHQVTLGALWLLTLSFVAIWAMQWSLLWLVLGVIVLDLACQAIHVTNQHLIVQVDPGSSSALIGSYMVFYSLGSGAGALIATTLYGWYGWTAVCIFGAALSAAALLAYLGGTSTSAGHRRCDFHRDAEPTGGTRRESKRSVMRAGDAVDDCQTQPDA